MKHTIVIDFTHDSLQKAFNEGKQAFLNGKAIACPYAGKETIPLRMEWLAGYSAARNHHEKR